VLPSLTHLTLDVEKLRYNTRGIKRQFQLIVPILYRGQVLLFRVAIPARLSLPRAIGWWHNEDANKENSQVESESPPANDKTHHPGIHIDRWLLSVRTQVDSRQAWSFSKIITMLHVSGNPDKNLCRLPQKADWFAKTVVLNLLSNTPPLSNCLLSQPPCTKYFPVQKTLRLPGILLTPSWGDVPPG